jgi:hypothetical protein
MREQDETEQRLMSQLANLRLKVRTKESELNHYRRSKCRVKVGDVIQAGERKLKVYAVEPDMRITKLRCYRQNKDGQFGGNFCVVHLDDDVKVL